MQKYSGIIKWYSKEKNYGFIKGDDGKDYFMHSSSFETEDLQNIFDGIKVVFEVKSGYKGPVAIKVQIKESDVIG